jgi:hypothetical protein
MKSSKYISGPYNMAHLRGNIDGKPKNIYLMFDVHNTLDKQTDCLSNDIKKTDTIDVVDFFKNLFVSTKEKIDFMMEIHIEQIMRDSDHHVNDNRYISKMWEFTRSSFNVNVNKTAVIKSKIYPNVRIHYLDVRDAYFDYIMPYDFYSIAFNNITAEMSFDNKNFNMQKEYVEFIYERLLNFNNLIHEPSEQPNLSNEKNINLLEFYHRIGKKTIKHENIYILNYISNKIKRPYKYSQVETCIEHMKENMKKYFKNIAKLYDSIMDMTDIFKFKEMSDLLYSFYSHMITYSLYLMDMYTVRRITEKDYINNVFLYTGGAHSDHYMFHFIKCLGFELIDISYNPFDTIDELVNNIKNTESYEDLFELLFGTGTQCSKIIPIDINIQ